MTDSLDRSATYRSEIDRHVLPRTLLILIASFALSDRGSAAEITASPEPIVATDDPDVKPAGRAPAPRPAPRGGVATDSERDVLQMVEQHLPEVKWLLDQLKKKEPRQYDIAIRNLAKSARRLQAAKKRGEAAFELEVQIIKAQSSINLLIAKLKVRDDKDDRDALLAATKELEAAELARARYELTQLKSRLKRMRENVAAAEERLRAKQSNSEQNVGKNFQTYLRKSGRK